MKSQSGQYMSPLLIVGTKSLFNLAMISGAVSPVNQIRKAIKARMSLHAKLVCNRRFLIAKVGAEGVLPVTLSELSFSYHAQQYKVGINVHHMQPYPATSSNVVRDAWSQTLPNLN